MIYLVSYVEKEKRHDTEPLSIDRVLNKEHFYGKIMRKFAPKAPLFILVNNP